MGSFSTICLSLSMEFLVLPSSQKILMCAPDYFGVNYVINPWMEGQRGNSNAHLAQEQWQNLRQALEKYVELDFVPSQPDLPRSCLHRQRCFGDGSKSGY